MGKYSMTVLLKSGGNVVMDNIKSEESLKEITESYARDLYTGSNIESIVFNGPTSSQIIPIDNVACIDIKEVKK